MTSLWLDSWVHGQTQIPKTAPLFTTDSKYMEYMGFFDAEPANITLTGKFGIPDSNGKLMLKKK